MAEVSTTGRVRSITVPGHAYGFPGVAFGGYLAGLLAREFPGLPAKVSFRRPTPVGRPVELRDAGHGTRELADGSGALATARPCEPVRAPERVPERVPEWREAERAVRRQAADGPLNGGDCFACNTGRPIGRGLRQLFAPLPEASQSVALWTPDPQLAPDAEELPVELVWAGLDCPGGWVSRLFGGAPVQTVTASLAATVLRPVRIGVEHLVLGWPVTSSGRKHLVGSAILTRDGELCASAEALWLTPGRAV
ncbi:hypothetical protein [Kitasatospora viridis]|uniref:Thioesterase superfamily protein n=1 Tax=Kitasatospora viridis TaxID=281105 RepID=A0A561TTT5_9ACTN|nr:hypothetical protein [Kitasatospora viridis]TWF90497.1 hypothetical protein FHX73_13544 [Kitasatospora viridis]